MSHVYYFIRVWIFTTFYNSQLSLVSSESQNDQFLLQDWSTAKLVNCLFSHVPLPTSWFPSSSQHLSNFHRDSAAISNRRNKEQSQLGDLQPITLPALRKKHLQTTYNILPKKNLTGTSSGVKNWVEGMHSPPTTHTHRDVFHCLSMAVSGFFWIPADNVLQLSDRLKKSLIKKSSICYT